MPEPAAIGGGLCLAAGPQLERIEEAGLNASQPCEQLLLDGWLLRFSPGRARRARCVNAIAAGTVPLAEKIALCRRWYGRFRLPLLIRITPFSQPAVLDVQLERLGFLAFDETRVMSRSLDGLTPTPDRLTVLEVDARTFAAAVGGLRNAPQAQIDAHQRRLLDSPLQTCAVRLVAVDAAGAPLAAGQVVAQDDLAGLYDIITAPAQRGRGLGRAVSRRLLAAGAAMGATTAYLQVDAGNVPARRIYSGLGFADRYAYWYRRPADVVDEFLLEEGRTR